jgi:hypothetical protein
VSKSRALQAGKLSTFLTDVSNVETRLGRTYSRITVRLLVVYLYGMSLAAVVQEMNLDFILVTTNLCLC